jgi:hypothetical protein
MRNKHQRMKLSREEEIFLRHWIYDEVHFRDGTGPAKRLQVAHKVPPFELALVISAAMTEPGEQETAAEGPPPADTPVWPWPADNWAPRLAEARTLLAQRQRASAN